MLQNRNWNENLAAFTKTVEVQFERYVKWRLQWTSGTKHKFTQLQCELSNNFHWKPFSMSKVQLGQRGRQIWPRNVDRYAKSECQASSMMEQSLTWEDNISSASWEIAHIWWNPKVYYLFTRANHLSLSSCLYPGLQNALYFLWVFFITLNLCDFLFCLMCAIWLPASFFMWSSYQYLVSNKCLEAPQYEFSTISHSLFVMYKHFSRHSDSKHHESVYKFYQHEQMHGMNDMTLSVRDRFHTHT